MSILGRKQRKFSRDFALLLQYAYALGYTVTFPPEHTDHILLSLHYIGLAKDINLFLDTDEDGKEEYLILSKQYKELGVFWESLGNTWGGRFTRRGKPYPDGGHFSIEHNGIK